MNGPPGLEPSQNLVFNFFFRVSFPSLSIFFTYKPTYNSTYLTQIPSYSSHLYTTGGLFIGLLFFNLRWPFLPTSGPSPGPVVISPGASFSRSPRRGSSSPPPHFQSTPLRYQHGEAVHIQEAPAPLRGDQAGLGEAHRGRKRTSWSSPLRSATTVVLMDMHDM